MTEVRKRLLEKTELTEEQFERMDELDNALSNNNICLSWVFILGWIMRGEGDVYEFADDAFQALTTDLAEYV